MKTIRVQTLIFLVVATMLLLGCENKQTNLSVFRASCDNAAKEIDGEIGNLINTIDSNNADSYDETFLPIINHLFLLFDNALNVSLELQYNQTDVALKSAAKICELSLRENLAVTYSNKLFFESLKQQELTEQTIATQHFSNKLYRLFRMYGADKSEQEKNNIIVNQENLSAVLSNQRQCEISDVSNTDDTVTDCWQVENDINNGIREISTMLGYPNPMMWKLENTMALTEDKVLAFIQTMSEMLNPTTLSAKASTVVQSNELEFSSGSVQTGLFDALTNMFGIEFFKKENKKSIGKEKPYFFESDKSEKFDVLKNGKIIGGLYFKYSNEPNKLAGHDFFILKKGIKGLQLPEGVIHINQPTPLSINENNSTISLNEVSHLFRSLGQFLSYLLASEQQWIGNSGVAIENDFQAVPGYVLEEWLYHPKLLKLILKDENGRPLGNDHLKNIRRSHHESVVSDSKLQLIMAEIKLLLLKMDASISLSEKKNYMSRELDKKLREHNINVSLEERVSVEKIILACKTLCYESLWSRMIAMDMMAVVDQWDELDRVVIDNFQEKILATGASRTAEDATTSFIGREYSTEAFKKYLAE